jgi:3-oxoacyl-[acyl-carrier protein] reductase
MKTILVTGGSKGIGKSLVFQAALKGYKVIFTYNKSFKDAKKICDKLKDKCVALKVDLSKDKERNKIFNYLKKNKIKIDCLVNNAAYDVERKKFEKIKLEEIKKVYEVNVFAVYDIINKTIKFMEKKKKWNSIINMSSTAAKYGGRNFTHYAPTKAAIENLTIGLSRELVDQKIRVLSVSPGVISTKLQNIKNKKLIDSIPQGRLGTANEVAKLILWLDSQDAEYINGTNITISGGK